MSQKESMYSSVMGPWCTSVTRFVQSLPQTELLELQRTLEWKRKSEDLY